MTTARARNKGRVLKAVLAFQVSFGRFQSIGSQAQMSVTQLSISSHITGLEVRKKKKRRDNVCLNCLLLIRTRFHWVASYTFEMILTTQYSVVEWQ